MIIKKSSEKLPEGTVRAYRLAIPNWAELNVEIEEDGYTFHLKNIESDVTTEQKYYFYKDSLAMMLIKIDQIIKNMLSEIES